MSLSRYTAMEFHSTGILLCFVYSYVLCFLSLSLSLIHIVHRTLVVLWFRCSVTREAWKKGNNIYPNRSCFFPMFSEKSIKINIKNKKNRNPWNYIKKHKSIIFNWILKFVGMIKSWCFKVKISWNHDFINKFV